MYYLCVWFIKVSETKFLVFFLCHTSFYSYIWPTEICCDNSIDGKIVNWYKTKATTTLIMLSVFGNKYPFYPQFFHSFYGCTCRFLPFFFVHHYIHACGVDSLSSILSIYFSVSRIQKRASYAFWLAYLMLLWQTYLDEDLIILSYWHSILWLNRRHLCLHHCLHHHLRHNFSNAIKHLLYLIIMLFFPFFPFFSIFLI